ncbi:hypothetical protein LguiB_020902 [Lonicera macranthoides]
MVDRKLEENGGISGESKERIIISSELESSTPKMRPKRNKYAFGCSILASMACVILGYDIGVMSGAVIYIKKDLKVSDVQIEILVGIINLYSLIGAAAAGRTSDWTGRRWTIVVAAGIFFAGALLMGFATDYAFLMVGRFVAGIGVGYALMIAPVYTAEISPASSRGFLTSFSEVFINVGIVLGYVSNYAFSKLPIHLGWRFMLGIGTIPSIFLAITVIALPESPRWLVMQGRLSDARHVLEKTSDSKAEAELRLADIKAACGIPENCIDDIVPIPKHSQDDAVWRKLLIHPTPSVRHILIAAIGVHFFQQSSGIDAVVLYSPRIFEKAGITDDTKKLLFTVAVGTTKTSFILVATFFLDKIGRRPLLLSSVGGMIMSLTLLGVALTVIDHYDGKAFSVGVAVNRVTSGVISMTFISLYKGITIGGAFFLFAGIASLALVFFYTVLPETRGKNLEEVEALFGNNFIWRSGNLKRREEADWNGQI